MSVLAIVLIAVGAVLVILFVGGVVAVGRRRTAQEQALRRNVEEANAELARAHAEDRGWHPEIVEQAARDAWESLHPGAPIDALHLVQVIDRPGTDDDEAVFHVVSGGRRQTVRLGRRDGAWLAVTA